MMKKIKESKEEASKDGFKLGDYVKHKKTGMVGEICGFEWSGVKRALIKENEKSKDYKVISVEELELVMSEIKQVEVEEKVK